MSIVEMCEGCNETPATTFDSEGVPLCKVCSELPTPIISAQESAAASLSEPKPEVKEGQGPLDVLKAILPKIPRITDAPADNAQAVLQNALGRALADLQLHAISFHINPLHGNYYLCKICNAESKESNLAIQHSEGCSIASCLVAIRVAPSVVAGIGEHAMGVSSDEALKAAETILKRLSKLQVVESYGTEQYRFGGLDRHAIHNALTAIRKAKSLSEKQILGEKDA